MFLKIPYPESLVLFGFGRILIWVLNGSLKYLGDFSWVMSALPVLEPLAPRLPQVPVYSGPARVLGEQACGSDAGGSDE